MKKEDAKSNKDNPKTQLPRKRTRTLNEIVNNFGSLRIILLGLSIYILIVLIVSGLEFFFRGKDNFIGSSCDSNTFSNLLYFNFITILTIGYGDYSPTGTLFRTLSVSEALIGVAMFGTIASILTIKFLQPNKNTIIFSKHGYYSLKDQSFMVIYLNTSKDYINNLQTAAYVKSGNNWGVGSAITAPFLTRAVQTFFLQIIPLDRLVENFDERDCMRVGFSGNLGMSSYSTSIEYSFDNIIVIPNREYLTSYEGFWKVNDYLKNHRSDFEKHFHYHPVDAPTLLEYLKQSR